MDSLKKQLNIFLIVFCIFAVFLFSACKTGSDPVDTLDQMLKYIRDGKEKKAEKLMYNPEDFSIETGSTIALSQAIRKHLSWNVADAHLSEDGTYYEVELLIHNIDVAQGFGELADKYMDDMMADAVNGIAWEDDTLSEELLSDLNEMIESDDPPVQDYEVTVFVVPDGNGSWLVFITQDLTNALTGGALEMLQHEGFSY